LGPQMKSVGEVMALGSTFPAALNKAVQSLEIGVDALDGSGPKRAAPADPQDVAELAALRQPTADRLFAVYRAVRAGLPLEAIAAATGFDPWFLAQMAEIAACEREVTGYRLQVTGHSLSGAEGIS